MKVEEAAAKRQAKIDSKTETIVGVNKYRLAEEDPIDILDIDNAIVRQTQIERLEKMKAERDEEEVQKHLARLTKAAEDGSENLLAVAVDAARARASLR